MVTYHGLKTKGLFVLPAILLVILIIPLFVFAAVTSVSFEAEAGQRTGSAEAVNNDSSARGGGYLNFASSTPSQIGTWVNIDPPAKIRNFNDPPDNYGAQTIAVAKSDPNIVIVGTNYQGLWKTTNQGSTWTRLGMNITADTWCPEMNGRNWTLAIDPTNPNIIYTVSGYGCYQSLWKSTDGGVTWFDAIPPTVQEQTTNDIYSVAINPSDHLHILVAFHSDWHPWTPQAVSPGVIESKDGGATWRLIPAPTSWGAGDYVHFLDDSNTWLVATQSDGYWRTTNAGASWTKVIDEDMSHGMNQSYKSANGTWYISTSRSIQKSVNGGASWSTAFSSPCGDGFGGVIGDGTRLYASPANTGTSLCSPVHYYTALESNDTSWTQYNNQTFTNGPMNMALDPIRKIVYSSNWNGGVWKLQY